MKKISWLVLLLMAGMLVVWGCGGDDDGGGTPTPTGTGSISGIVDGGFTKSVINGATISVGTLTATTNEQGYFTLANVPVGQRVVDITMAGYLSVQRVIRNGHDIGFVLLIHALQDVGLGQHPFAYGPAPLPDAQAGRDPALPKALEFGKTGLQKMPMGLHPAPAFDQGGVLQRLKPRPVGHGPLAPAFADNGDFLAVLARPGEGGVNDARRIPRDTRHDREVAAVDRVIGELLGQSLMRLVMLGNDKQPRRILVDTMDNSRPRDAADSAQRAAAMVE